MANKNNGFGKGTFSHIRQELRNDIINAPESKPELRKEMARVFQVANRRIQNIEKRGEFSPAVIALGKGDITKFSKFSMSGNSWVELKKEYVKAVTFLRQPTSTATGVREYTNHIKKAYDLTDEEYTLVSDNLNNKLQSVADSNFVERYLMRYKDYTGELQSEAKSISHQLESDSKLLIDSLDEEIDSTLYNVAKNDFDSLSLKQAENVIDQFLNLDDFW